MHHEYANKIISATSSQVCTKIPHQNQLIGQYIYFSYRVSVIKRENGRKISGEMRVPFAFDICVRQTAVLWRTTVNECPKGNFPGEFY